MGLPEGLLEIDNFAFNGCASLTAVSIPASVKKLGDGAFSSCVCLTEMEIPETVEQMGWGMFSGCKALTRVSVPKHLTKIGQSTFRDCASLIEFRVPPGVTELEKGAFAGCKGLRSVAIPRNACVDKEVFVGCVRLASLEMGDRAIAITNREDSAGFELAALRVPIGEWKAKEKPAAVRGFALARQAGMEMEEALQAGYLSYIRRQRKRLYPLAVGHEEVLRLMIAEKMIPKKDVSLLLDEAEARQNAAAKALILEYGRKL